MFLISITSLLNLLLMLPSSCLVPPNSFSDALLSHLSNFPILLLVMIYVSHTYSWLNHYSVDYNFCFPRDILVRNTACNAPYDFVLFVSLFTFHSILICVHRNVKVFQSIYPFRTIMSFIVVRFMILIP